MSARELLLDLDRLGIRLEAEGERLRFHPRSALTTDLLDRLKAHKAELLAMLHPEPSPPAKPVSNPHRPVQTLQQLKPICRCGSTTWRDVVLCHAPHNGTTTRRDCGRCGRFLDFPIWYGKSAGHNGQ